MSDCVIAHRVGIWSALLQTLSFRAGFIRLPGSAPESQAAPWNDGVCTFRWTRSLSVLTLPGLLVGHGACSSSWAASQESCQICQVSTQQPQEWPQLMTWVVPGWHALVTLSHNTPLPPFPKSLIDLEKPHCLGYKFRHILSCSAALFLLIKIFVQLCYQKKLLGTNILVLWEFLISHASGWRLLVWKAGVWSVAWPQPSLGQRWKQVSNMDFFSSLLPFFFFFKQVILSFLNKIKK